MLYVAGAPATGMIVTSSVIRFVGSEPRVRIRSAIVKEDGLIGSEKVTRAEVAADHGPVRPSRFIETTAGVDWSITTVK